MTLQGFAPAAQGLPEAVKAQCEDRASSYSFGWSHGKEAMEDGKADRLKGSYYNNPVQDNRHSSATLMAEFPSYCRWGHATAGHLRQPGCGLYLPSEAVQKLSKS